MSKIKTSMFKRIWFLSVEGRFFFFSVRMKLQKKTDEEEKRLSFDYDCFANGEMRMTPSPRTNNIGICRFFG